MKFKMFSVSFVLLLLSLILAENSAVQAMEDLQVIITNYPSSVQRGGVFTADVELFNPC